MSFKKIFDVFSRRTAPPAPSKPLTDSFRHRVLMRCRDVFASYGNIGDFWHQIHSKLTYLRGIPVLTSSSASPAEDVLLYLRNCSDEQFLDFIEFIFQADVFFQTPGSTDLVADINDFFEVDDLPYALTDFVWTSGTTQQFGRSYQSSKLTAYPQIIPKGSDVLYSTAMQPALQLLRAPEYKAANSEFLDALKDFRHGDYGDCLTKCGSSFESVLKITCHKRGWPYTQQDTAATLIKTVVTNAPLEPFFDQPFMLIATIRNRLSKSHGAGMKSRQVSREIAEYALNATASAILFVVSAT